MAVTVPEMLKMSQTQLDDLFTPKSRRRDSERGRKRNSDHRARHQRVG